MKHNEIPQINLPVAIIGGGPVGLAAAAHLVKQNEPFILFEAGEDVASNVQTWKHVRIFSPWRYNLADPAVELLKAHGWQSPDLDVLPTGEELIENYFRPLVNLPELNPFIYYNARVTAVSRKGLDKMVTQGREHLPFVIQVDIEGVTQTFAARAVIDASGTWNNPNPIGSGGIAATGEQEAREHVFYGIPDILGIHRSRYAGKKVMVVGSGHSSINALLDLLALKEREPETEVIWALRKKQLQQVYGGEADDALPARGTLGSRIRAKVAAAELEVLTPFHISDLSAVADKFDVRGKLAGADVLISGIDEFIANTGSRPDISFLREVRAAFDPVLESVPELAPLIDPNVHSCGTVRPHGERELRQPEKDFYIVGVKSYGRAPTFLMATGYEQVRSVVAALVGDWEAAAKVELNLPETGVCRSDVGETTTTAPSVCCGSEEVVAKPEPVAAACCGSVDTAVSKTESVATSACCGETETAIPTLVSETVHAEKQPQPACC